MLKYRVTGYYFAPNTREVYLVTSDGVRHPLTVADHYYNNDYTGELPTPAVSMYVVGSGANTPFSVQVRQEWDGINSSIPAGWATVLSGTEIMSASGVTFEIPPHADRLKVRPPQSVLLVRTHAVAPPAWMRKDKPPKERWVVATPRLLYKAALHTGRVFGNTTCLGNPVRRYVWALDSVRMERVGGAYAAEDGSFEIRGLDMDRTYLIVAQDRTDGQNAVVFDRVSPVPY